MVVGGIVQHMGSAVEPFHGWGMLGHKQCMMVEAAAVASWPVVHTRHVDTHSHKDYTEVEGMAAGIGIHKEADDSSVHACCTQGWCCHRLTPTYCLPTLTESNHAAVGNLMGGSNHPWAQQCPVAWLDASSNCQDA